MGGPWEKYQSTGEAEGPWTKYKAPTGEAKPEEPKPETFRLANGKETVRRPDGYVWLDETKGMKQLTGGQNQGPGWYRWRDAKSSLVTGKDLALEGKKGEWLRGPDTAIPENDDQILNRLGYDRQQIQKIKSAPAYVPGDLAWRSGMQQYTETGGKLARFMQGFASTGSGIGELIQKAGQKLGVIPEGNVLLSDAMNKLGEERYRMNKPEGLDIAKGVGEAIPLLAAPSTSLKNLTPSAIAKVAATGAVTGALQPTGDMSRQDFWAQKAKQAATGAVVAPIAQAAGERLVEKVVAPAVSKVAGKVYNTLKKTPLEPKVQELVDAAEAANITKYTVGDLTGDRTAKFTERRLEDIPAVLGGIGKVRGQASQEISAAAKAKGEKFADLLRKTEYGGIKEAQAAAANGDRNAQRILNLVREAGDNPDSVLQVDLELNMLKGKRAAGKAYDKVAKAVSGMGNVDVAPTVQWIDDQLAQQAKSVNPNDQLVKVLERTKSLITDPNRDTSYMGLRNATSGLGDSAKELAQRGDYVASKAMGELKNVLRTNMDDWVTQNGTPEATRLLNQANRTYQTRVVPYREQSIAKMISGVDADRAVAAVRSNVSPDQYKRIYDLTSDKGKAAMRSILVEDALKAATNESTGHVSPAKFASYFEKRGEQSGIAFKGVPAFEVDGFVKLLRAMERTGQMGAGSDTGKSVVPYIIGGTIAKANPLALVGGVGVAHSARYLLTNPAGRRFLLASSKLPTGSPQLERMVTEELPQLLSKIAAQQKAKPETEKEPE